MSLPDVGAIATKLLDDGVAIVISVDPNGSVPAELVDRRHVDGVRLVINREHYTT
jgi:hypothetical protein